MERQEYNSQFDKSESLKYYFEMKNKLDRENENFNFIISHMPPIYADTDTYIKNYVKNLSLKELHSRANGLIESQDLNKYDYLIEHMSEKNQGNFSHFHSQWSPIIWQTHENNTTQKIKIGEKIVNTCDLDFSIAQTIEIQDAHRDPLTEYHDWIKIQKKLESDIYTNGTTFKEIQDRNHFIDFMDMREMEIKRIALLYAGCALNPNSPMQTAAQEKLKFVIFKLSELRRLRDRMKSTKSIPDKPKKKRYLTTDDHDEQNQYVTHEDDMLTEEENNKKIDFDISQKSLTNIFMLHSLNNHLIDNYKRIKPETSSTDEAISKINTLINNSQNIKEMLMAMRNGMSKEEWIDKQNTQTVKPRKINGFNINRYNQALKELTS